MQTMVPSVDRPTPLNSDPAPAVILLPRQGGVKGRIGGLRARWAAARNIVWRVDKRRRGV